MSREFCLQRIVLFLRNTDLLDDLLKRDRAICWSAEGEVSSVIVWQAEEFELVLGGILAFRVAFRAVVSRPFPVCAAFVWGKRVGHVGRLADINPFALRANRVSEAHHHLLRLLHLHRLAGYHALLQL